MSTFPTVDKDTVLARARAAIENRTKYIESLFDAAGASAEARDKVAEATRAAERADTEHAAAYQEALDAGWTAAELTESGLTAPTSMTKKPSRGKASKRSSRTGSSARRRVGLVPPVNEPNDNTASTSAHTNGPSASLSESAAS